MTAEPNNTDGNIQGSGELHSGEAFLGSLIDTIPIPIFYKDRGGCFIGCNTSFEELYGVKRHEITGKNVFDITASNLAKIYHIKDKEVIDNSADQRYETHIRDKNGKLRDVIAHKAPLKDGTGNITGIIGTILDITDRKQAEEIQHRLNRELRAISSCRQAMIRATGEQSLLNDICRIICDEAGYRMAWVGFLEHDEERTIQPVVWHGHNSGYMERAKLSWSNETERGRGPAGEAARQGTYIYVEDIANDPRMAPWREDALSRGYRSSVGAPLKNEDGNVVGLLSVYSDEAYAFTQEEIRLIEELAQDMSFGISVIRTRAERMKTAEALRLNEEKYRTIFHNSPLGIFRSTIEGRFLEVNPALAAMLHYESPEAMVREIHDIGEQLYFRHEDRQQIVSQQLHVTDDATQYLNHYRRKDGSECIANLYLKIVRDEQNRPLYLDGIIEDITETVKADREREALEEQLQQAQKIESIGRLAGGIAHDFNNMLGVIVGYTELALRRTSPDEKLHLHLQETLKAAKSSADLTRQLLAFARKQTITPKVMDLNETVEGMLNMLRRLIGEDIDLEWVPGDETWPVKVDSSQIDQILANICINASDAIGERGKVGIKTDNAVLDDAYCACHPGATPGDYVLLAVRDNGNGMEEETLARAFEPFFTTKEMGKGTGLGLATVYGIVKQNNGYIDIKSTLGQGTSVEIYLPSYTGEKTAQGEENSTSTGIEQGSETVLLVEDETAILDITRLILEKCGYRVLTASTPETGIRIAGEHGGDIDLLITDVIMPGMNGRELAAEVKRLYPDIKKLFMSGYSDNAIAHQGVLDEGVHFIQKPFSMQDLSDKVRGILDTPD